MSVVDHIKKKIKWSRTPCFMLPAITEYVCAGYQTMVPGSVPSDYSTLLGLSPLHYASAGHIAASTTPDRSRPGSGTLSGGGGGAMRNRSGDRRWDGTGPYGGERGSGYYSSSLSTYLSPPPESRWRRTSSDSALYQSAAKAGAAPQGGSSEAGSPFGEDLKPSPDLLGEFYPLDDLMIKQEPGADIHQRREARSPKSPCSPCSPLSPSGGTSPTYLHHYIPPDLESGKQLFIK